MNRTSQPRKRVKPAELLSRNNIEEGKHQDSAPVFTDPAGEVKLHES